MAPVAELDDETPLFSSGLIDSFALVDLILLIERECRIRVGPTEVTLDNLDSIARILRFAGNRVEAQRLSA